MSDMFLAGGIEYHLPYLRVMCPKCGAPPGQQCVSIKNGQPMSRPWHMVHKKREIYVLLGAPSTERLAVPVRLSVLKARARVGAVDSAPKSLKAG